MPKDLETAGAGALAAALTARDVSALELCDAAIARIERDDRAINAIVVHDFERAREQARERDAALARGERAPLLGVPMTVKEGFDVAGLPSSWGLEPFRDRRASEDAVLVQRLKAAGAVILGKSNVPPSLADWHSDNPVYGRTVNPHDATRTPGGSSGGSAAALAAGLVPLELGSDIGGSIRVPAHFCGVFGHKPSYGLLPTRGHEFPGTDGEPIELAVCGPMARHAADLDLALGILAGPDDDDRVAYRCELPPARHPTPKGLRVLLLDEHPRTRADSEVRGALQRLGDALQREGAVVERHTPLLPDLDAAHGQYVRMLNAALSQNEPAQAPPISAPAWLELRHQRFRLRRQWRALFAQFDVLLLPPFGTAAFEHTTEPDWSRRTLRIDGENARFGNQIAWSGLATFPGLPATVAPMARTRGGLPLGVQIVGPWLEDRTPIAVACMVETIGRV